MIESSPVNSLNQGSSRLQPLKSLKEGDSSSPSFREILKGEVEEVNQQHLKAQNLMEKLMAGEDVPREKVMVATRKAELSFQLLMEIRNKLMEAHDELMRMQV